MALKSRLNLKIDKPLKNWIMEFAEERGTTVTNIICAYLYDLKEQEEKKQTEELVEQI